MYINYVEDMKKRMEEKPEIRALPRKPTLK